MPVYFRLLTLEFVRLPLRLVKKNFNLCGVLLYEMGFRPFMGSVHLDPSWVCLLWVRPLRGLCISLRPWWGPSTLWIGVLSLGGVRPLRGLCISLRPWWGPSTLWIVVLTLGGVRPLCGLV